jgi:16S rRNA (cytosine1402-N4)-methyltransferase
LDEHIPVLVDEAVKALAVQPAGAYVDATFGRGGHSARILAELGPGGRLIAIDRDPQAIAAGRTRFASEPRCTLVPGAFGELAALVRATLGERACDGVLIDCGVSSPQLDTPERGFSFQADGPLDMRMDTTRGEPLSLRLARAGGDEIRDVIARLGEERFARRISESIVRERSTAPITRTLQLAEIVARAVPVREPGKNPATRTFQALRMWVNDELGQLRSALQDALAVLSPGGRLAVISFHSLEDAVVRDFMQRHSAVAPELAHLPQVPASALPLLALVGRKLRASTEEVARNPRARSALLRVAARTATATLERVH